MRIAVLALQGDYAKHLQLLNHLGADAFPLRRTRELAEADGVVLPGGESTTLYKLLRGEGLDTGLAEFACERPVFGTCAGLILMARALRDAGGVESFGLLDVEVQRNGFGRQIDSFEDRITMEPGQEALADGAPHGVFIRAPRILDLGSAECLGRWNGEPVAVRQGMHMGLSFHPELSGDARWHRAWMEHASIARPA